jgi:hypothetical protein
VAARLAAVRGRLTLWLLVEGVGRVLLALLALFVVSFLLDYLFRLDTSQRAFLLLVMLAAHVWIGFTRLVRPLATPVSDDALLLAVESQHPPLAESLISAVQFERLGDQFAPHTSREFVRATIAQGLAAAEPVPFEAVVDRVRFRHNLLILLLAAAGVSALVVLGLVGNQWVTTWVRRNVLLQQAYWPQQTYLTILRADGGRLRIARGDDYLLQVDVTRDSRRVPDKVFLDFGDGRPSLALKRVDAPADDAASPVARFEAVLASVIEPFDLRARGGDAITEYVRVELVEPPALETVSLTLTLPAYAGGATEELPAGKGPYFVLPGSSLSLAGRSNKPLSGGFLVRDAERFPLQVSGEREISLALAPEKLATGTHVIELIDQEGLTAKRPASFGLRLRADREPRVRARLLGIGGMVTSRARLPLECRATDDYGLAAPRVEFRWRGAAEDRQEGTGTWPLPNAVTTPGVREALWPERWELESLAIPAGANLEFFLAVDDNDNYPDQPGQRVPNTGRSPDFSLRVVTDDELRSDLLRREKEQRQEFERLVKLQEELLTLARELDAQLGQNEDFTREQRDRFVQAAKNQKLIDTNSGSVAARMAGIVAEIENNQLEDPEGPLQSRLERKILQPLAALQETAFPAAVRLWEAARRTTGEFAPRRTALQETITHLEQTVREMRAILDEMSQAEGFQEAVNLLYELQKAQQEVLERTRQTRAEREKQILEGAESGK